MAQKINGYATCMRKECFAYRIEWNHHKDACTALWNNDFRGGVDECPFFKPWSKYKADKEFWKPKKKKYGGTE